MFHSAYWLQSLRGLVQKLPRSARRRKVRLRLESLEERLTPDSGGAVGQLVGQNVAYGGGALIGNVSVRPIFLQDAGSGQTTSAANQAQLNAFFQYLAGPGSPYIGTLLSPYGSGAQTIGTGNAGAADSGVQVTPDTSAGAAPALSDTLIQNTINAEIAAGRTGPATANTLYVVFTPPGDGVVTSNPAGNSTANFLGYHSSYGGANPHLYAVIPDPGAPNLNLSSLGLDTLQNLTVVASHEFAEAITDPDSPPGWENPSTGAAGEIADQAAQDIYTQDGWAVSYEWSNSITGPAYAPGANPAKANLTITQLSPPAVAGISGSIPVATFTDPDPNLTANNFKAVVSSVDSSGTSTSWSTTSIKGSNGAYVVYAQAPAPTVPGQVGNLFEGQGLVVTIYDQLHGGFGTGGPLTSKNSTYNVTASAPLSYNTNPGTNNLVLNDNGSDLVLTDNGLVVFSQPLAATTAINIGASPGASNSLTIDYTSGPQFDLPLTFDGGTGPGTHTLTLNGGTFTSISDQMNSANAGTISLLDPSSSFNLLYTNVAGSISLLPSSVSNLTLTPPAGGGTTNLQDDTTPGNGVSQLLGIKFPAINFTDPLDALLIDTSANSTTNVFGLDSQFTAGLTISDGGAGAASIGIDIPLNLGAPGVPGNVSLAANTVQLNNAINATNGGSITINDSQSLLLTNTAPLTADGPITLSGPGAISLAAPLTSNSSTLSLAGPVTLQTGLTLTGTLVSFASSVDDASGNDPLTIAGSASFASSVGANKAFTSLSVSANVALGSNVTTKNAQTYNGNAVLTGNATLLSTLNGNVSFAGTLDGAFSLAVNTGGLTTFTGLVGGSAPLTSLITDAAGTTALGSGVSTSGSQTYNDALIFNAPTANLTASAIGFNNTVDLATNTLNVAGNLTLAATATLQAQIAGTAPSQFGHISHTGGVDLGNATLQMSMSASPIPNVGTVFDLIAVNSSGALAGNTFKNLPEGGLVSVGSEAAKASYKGGGGSDFTLTITDAPPSQVAFLQQPSVVTAGQAISPPVKVAIEDAVGDVLTSQNTMITLKVNTGPGPLVGTTVSVQAVNGVATFSNDLFLQTAGSYTLLASDGALSTATSASFSVIAAAADHLNISPATPPAVQAGTALPTINVAVVDQFNNTVNTSGTTINIAASGPGSFTAGTTTATTTSGVASFTGLTLTKAGVYTLVASTPQAGVSNGTSNSFTVSAATPSKLGFAAPPLPDTIAGQQIPGFNVDILDQYGNVTTSTATVTIQASGPGGFLAGAITSVAAVNGVASFGGLTLTVAGPYALQATSGTLPAQLSNIFTVHPAGASQLFFPTAIGNYTAGTTLNDVEVDVLDQYNNLVPVDNQQITLMPAAGSPQTTFSTGANSASTTGGKAIFSGLSLQKAGGYTLDATASGLNTGVSNSFTITPASPYQLILASSTPSSITAGTTLPAVQVLVEDQYFNPVPTATGPIHLDAIGPVTVGADSTVAQGAAQFNHVVLTTAGDYTLSISAPNLLPVSSPTITVDPAGASQVAILSGPVDSQAGQFLPDLQVEVQDPFGNPVNSSASLTVSANGPGTFPATTTTTATASGGMATFSNLQLDTAGIYTLTVGGSGLQPATSTSFTIGPAAANHLVFESSPGTTTAGDTLPTLKVDFEDQFGNHAAGSATVTLNAILNGSTPGMLIGNTMVVASNGVATFSGLTLDTSGDYVLQAETTGSVTSALSTSFTVNPATPTTLAFEADPATTTAGSTLGPVKVDVSDAFGNPVSGVPVTISVTGPAGFSAGTTTQTSVSGVATFGDLVLKTAGTYTLSAVASGLSMVSTNPFVISPAGASQLAITTSVPDTTAGVPLPDLKIAIEDPFGNVVTTASATITLAASGAGISAGPTSAMTSGGIAIFHGDTIDTEGSYTLAASATGLATGKSAPFNITPSAATQLTFSAPPINGTAGQAQPEVDVSVLDSFGNPISGVPVKLAVNGPGAPSAGTTSASTGANGAAAFPGLTLPTAGTYTLTASAGSLTLTSGAFTISPAAAAQLAFTVNPVNGTAGTALPDVQVQVQDAFGNLVSSTATITLAATGPGGFSAGTTSAAAIGGVATFSGLVLKTAGTYTLSVSSGGLTAGTSAAFTIAAAAPSQVNFEAVPATAVAGTALPDLKVDIEDAFGNLVAGTGATISLSVAGPGGLSAGPSSANATNGTAIFSGLTFNTAGSYTLTVSAPGLQANSAPALSVKPAAPAQLAFLSSPTGAVAGQAIAPVTVAVEDAFGNLVMGSSFNVTLTLTGPANPSGNSATLATTGGTATFTGLTLQTAGVYALSASAPGLATATTSSFTVSPGPASQISFDASPVSVSAGQALPAIQVNVQDAFGNAVTGTSVSLTVNGPGSPVSGATTAPAQNGVATFNGLTLQTAGSYTLTARVTGLQPVTSSAFTVSPAAATHLAFAANPGNLSAGQPLPTVQVLLLDPFGNQANSSGVVVSLSSTGPVVLGATATTAQGLATFNNLVLKTAGTYTLSASAAGLTGTTTSAFAVTPAAASQLVFEANPVDTLAGQAIPTFKVDIQDAFGNIVVGSTTPVTISATGPSGFAAGTTTVTPAGGVATFSGLVLQKAGSYTLTVGAAGLAAATSAVFKIVPGSATQLVFVGAPTSGGAGQPLAPIQVDIVDAFGNLTGSNAPVTLGVSGPGAPVAGTLNSQAQNGVATFDGLLLQKSGSYTFTAGGAGLTSATSAAVTIAPGAPSQLVFEPLPAGGTAGQTLPPIKVDVLDVFGNLTNGNTPVTLVLSGTAVPGGESITVAASNGVATFSGLVPPTAGGYSLLASAAGVTAAGTGTFTAAPASSSSGNNGPNPITIIVPPVTPPSNGGTTTTAGPPALVRFVLSSIKGIAGHILPAVRVQVLDAHHRPVKGALVMLQLKKGHLFGTTKLTTDKNGYVVFKNLKVQASGLYTLIARTPKLKRTTPIRLTVAAIVGPGRRT